MRRLLTFSIFALHQTKQSVAFTASSKFIIRSPRTSSIRLPTFLPSADASAEDGGLKDKMIEKLGLSAAHEDDEWHPHDPAHTTPQLLSALWLLITQGNTMERGDTSTVIFPQMQHELSSPSYLNRLMGHLDVCKDVCDHFGITTVLLPYVDKGKVTGFTVKSYRNPDNKDGDFQFSFDPFWDEDDVLDYSGIDEELDGEEMAKSALPDIVDKIPDDDDEIIGTTKRWVDKMMSDCGICPFTKGPEMAGIPMGQVFYCVDRCAGMEEMYARYWKEVVRVEQNDELDLSTTLLICPEFCMDQIDLFESFTNTLTQPLTTLEVEDLLQLVFFHPYWTFRDGGDRSGLGAAANYARRSPWPMINILRTNQVRAAQKGIPTGLVYQQNEKMLSTIGIEKLETMLRLRDWNEIADLKVDRRDMEALRMAQDFQQSGVVAVEDTTFEHDSAPAANKVDSGQIEQGNLLNVIKQALEKRLGMDETGQVKPLSGPETSATVMASDFLISELDRIAQSGRQEVSSEAHRVLMNDLMGDDEDSRDAETDVLFGGAGIMG